ncbi:prepilin-type N-terminal cleavage/methylation domain-containing protein [uncultured Tateyamaria sp.]|uniref:PulJ/GspJ family protein n=1 Tax=uncultured Tateyamaria sp. TaxID=455651 RepID=UPI0034385175
MIVRARTAGVTLIEMLVSLTISAMIGLAGFALLESVTRTEAGVAGRLDHLTLQDRAFRLLNLDMEIATLARLGEALELRISGQTIIWEATDQGVFRSVNIAKGGVIKQSLLDHPARLSRHASGILALRLPETGVWRLVSLPPTHSE